MERLTLWIRGQYFSTQGYEKLCSALGAYEDLGYSADQLKHLISNIKDIPIRTEITQIEDDYYVEFIYADGSSHVLNGRGVAIDRVMTTADEFFSKYHTLVDLNRPEAAGLKAWAESYKNHNTKN